MASLTQGSPGAAIDTTTATTKDLPAWYQDYTQNLATQAATVAQQNNSQPLPQQAVAGFNPTQTQAFDQTNANQGDWKPELNSAMGTNSQIAPTATGLVNNAQAAVSGPAQTWDSSTASKYMSPYTSNVVQGLTDAANRNWQNTIMPGINSSMIGNGEFGSTRNADALGQAGVDFQTQLNGTISNALQSGYTGAQAQFNSDATRTQQQGALQANTALTGASTDANALNTAATGAGALSQTLQSQGNTDNQSLLNIGNQQQTLQQTGLNTDYANAQAARTDPWTQINNMNGALSNVQLPSTVSTGSSGPAATYGPSALSGALSAYYLSQGINPSAPQYTTATAPTQTTGSN